MDEFETDVDGDENIVDPVLDRLLELPYSRTALARRIDVGRSTLSAWIADSKARKAGKAVPKPRRQFRYADQRPHVQTAIASLLEQPVETLRAESEHTWNPEGAGAEALVVGRVAGAVVGAVVGRAAGPGVLIEFAAGVEREVHETAELVMSVEGVAGTLIVVQLRGRSHRLRYQHQIVVYVAEQTPPKERDELREEINRRLDESERFGKWEHGELEAGAQITARGERLAPIGSLISPLHEAARFSQTPSLLPPPARFMLVMTVLSADYGGSKPVGGSLAQALLAGLVQGEHAARRALAHDDGHGAEVHPVDDMEERRSGLIQQELLSYLRRGIEVPGAWVLTTEMRYAKGYPPLTKTFEESDDLLVTLHQEGEWLRMAAWRLAAAREDDDGRGSVPPLRAGEPVTKEQDRLRNGHAAAAAEALEELKGWETGLSEIVEQRREKGLPTIAVTLSELPAAFERFVERDERWVPPAPDADPGDVVYNDDVDNMVDTWVEAAAAILGALVSEFDETARARFVAGLADEMAQLIDTTSVRAELIGSLM